MIVMMIMRNAPLQKLYTYVCILFFVDIREFVGIIVFNMCMFMIFLASFDREFVDIADTNLDGVNFISLMNLEHLLLRFV